MLTASSAAMSHIMRKRVFRVVMPEYQIRLRSLCSPTDSSKCLGIAAIETTAIVSGYEALIRQRGWAGGSAPLLSTWWRKYVHDEPGAVARSEACPLGMQAATSSNPTSGTFFCGDLVMKTFYGHSLSLPLTQEEPLSVTGE